MDDDYNANDLRAFDDVEETRRRIYDDVLSAARSVEPVKNNKYTLSLGNVRYVGPETFSKEEQKKALLTRQTLARQMRGTWTLHDAAGKQIAAKESMVAAVPFLSDRGTFTYNGNTYVMRNQQRLRPGVFTRVKNNGEIEAHVNVLPGKGRAHRYFLDPEKGVFYANVGQAKIPMLPLLRAFGLSDQTLRDTWGSAILAANYPHDKPAALHKYYSQFLSGESPPGETEDGKKKRLIEKLQQAEFDPTVMERTLGKPYTNLSADVLLATSKKLLQVARGEADTDDRDHLAFQTIHGPEDLMSERIRRDYGGMRRALLHKISQTGNLDRMPANALAKQVEAALLYSGLGSTLEEINIAELLDKKYAISRMGEGGIPSLDAVPDEARGVQPSHFGFLDPLRTPESMRTGVDLFLARNAKKGRDGKVYAPFVDMKTGQTVYKSPSDLADMAVSTPREFKRPGKRVAAMQGGRIRYVPRKDVTYLLPHFENAFSPLANLLPMKSAVHGQRAVMGSRMTAQALPLEGAEAPLVQSGMPDKQGRSYEEEYGTTMGALFAKQSGRVVSVDPKSIQVRYADGTTDTQELYNHFPFSRKTYFHQTPTVKPGDTVEKGTLLARSNHTDNKGVTALGLNLRVGYLPFRGLNFEDAVVVSESAAKRLKSEHMYQEDVELDEHTTTSKPGFLARWPAKFTRAQLDQLDAHGVVKPGSLLQRGDPLILAIRSQPDSRRVHKRGGHSFSDVSVLWSHDAPGEVTDTVMTKDGPTVLVKSVMPLQPGDKLAGRYGDKGIVSAVIPDAEVPRTQDGTPLDIMVNPLGLISRRNPAQIVEAALGKIAASRGKPYKVADFESIDDLMKYADDELRRHGISAREPLIDAETGRRIKGADGKGVLVGNRFYMKLHHTAETKEQGRGLGGYTAEEAPSKSSGGKSKRVAVQDTASLLSHGAPAVLQDALMVRGQKNDDYWLKFAQGFDPPQPKVPLLYEKFVSELKASGINVVPEGRKIHIMAMTDNDVRQLSGDREITSSDTVRFDKDLRPVPGGLFDPKLTGGPGGKRWSYVSFPEPMPNPVMEDPIRYLLKLTKKQFYSVLSGDQLYGDHGSGPRAIQSALADINVPREIEEARNQIRSGRRTARDEAIRRLGYLKSAQQAGTHPKDWMLSRLPVLPPIFRPISVMAGSQIPLVADANYLYKEFLEATKAYKTMAKASDDVSEERKAVYDSAKAVIGLGDPRHPKLQQKNVRGLLKHIFGSSPKRGTVQRKLLSSAVDIVGRATVSPNPDLDMDHVGIPENTAWDLYKMFVVRRLKRRGMPIAEAVRNVREKTPLARQQMLDEMESRPVFIHRAPVLHKFGILAFWPKLTKEHVLQVSPLVVNGFGMDFDGDAANFHVPVSREAAEQAADRMLPSRNLLSPADFHSPVHKPTQEYLLGLYESTRKPKPMSRPRLFRRRQDVFEAYRRGELDVDSPVTVQED